MSSGHRQDTLVLGEVNTVKGDTLTINVTYIFPQNELWFISTDDKIIVKTNYRKKAPDSASKKEFAVELNFPEEYRKETNPPELPTPGKKYLLSLNKETRWFTPSFYYPAWGLFEVKGDKYSDMQLVKLEHFESKEIQLFIKSGGKVEDFKYDDNNELVPPEKSKPN